jgi:geranyl-CoA carboxylase alpha subunit
VNAHAACSPVAFAPLAASHRPQQAAMSFSKILIANRGEIACRIIRTAKRLGYRSVAVYSEADADAPHVAAADEAVGIGAPTAQQSYLNIEALLAAAARAGADAVHPGYGFLSENAAFAQACETAGLVFIGPSAAAIAAMGDKAQAKARMIAAGLSCVPGYHGADQDEETLRAQAHRLGFPLMIKAAAGGGGRGLRRIEGLDGFAEALERARSEALSAFGSDALILETVILEARHVEIQIAADAYQNIIHLGERDGSIQRRHQKVVEEAPSPAVSERLRCELGEAAIAAARAIDYRGVGTVEFLLDRGGQFYFLEMNTRLQVEHPVTEAVTGIDLVGWQLAIAAGEKLPIGQSQVAIDGHAIEARLYAEDPFNAFLPQTGTVIDWRPASGAGVRIDHGLAPGQMVSSFYDPLLAKVIAHGANREQARRRLIAALEDSVLFGIPTNRGFLISMLKHQAFVAGEATTNFIDQHFSAAMPTAAADARILALCAVLLREGTLSAAAPPWFSTGAGAWPVRFSIGQDEAAALVSTAGPHRYHVALTAAALQIEIVDRQPGVVRFRIDGLQRTACYHATADALYLDLGGVSVMVRDITLSPRARAPTADASRLVAPMTGCVLAVLAKPGERVAKGQRVVVLEAMKMQHEIVAERDGILAHIAVKPGDQVASRQLVAELSAPAGADDREDVP